MRHRRVKPVLASGHRGFFIPPFKLLHCPRMGSQHLRLKVWCSEKELSIYFPPRDNTKLSELLWWSIWVESSLKKMPLKPARGKTISDNNVAFRLSGIHWFLIQLSYLNCVEHCNKADCITKQRNHVSKCFTQV